MTVSCTNLFLGTIFVLSVFSGVSAVCPPGWREYDFRCYLFSTQRHPFSQYEDFCTRRNATIWSSHSVAEMAWVGNVTHEIGSRILYWSGLTLVNHRWTWKDQTPYGLSSVTWYRKQEGNKNSGNLCAGLYSYPPDVGEMQQRRCRDSWGMICTKSNTALDVCDSANGWHLADGWCLKYFSEAQNWYDARRTCASHQGDLTIYKDYNQLLDLYDVVPCNGDSQKSWIGLSDTVQPRTWRWINNDTMRYSRWQSYGNKILLNGSTCAVSDRLNGFTWESKTCSSEYPFICNRSQGACPTGWLANGDRCYQLIDTATSQKTFFDAKVACESQGTSLLVINDDNEQSFITSVLEHQHADTAWLGFSDVMESNVLRWTDGGLVTGLNNYQHWAPNFPQTQDKMFDCGLITKGRSHDSRWSNGYCYNYKPYICEMKVTGQPYLPTIPPPQFHCDKNWQLYNGHCYYFGPVGNQTLKTWTEAQVFCQSSGGANLVILNDAYEISYVTVQQSKVVTAWIGLKYNTKLRKLLWVDNTSPGDKWMNETNFHPGEPDDLDNGQYCIQIRGDGSNYRGSWDDGNCTTTQGFICEKNAYPGAFPQAPTTPPYNSWSPLCGVGWIYSSVENFCYQIDLTRPKSWQAARADCQSKGGDIASITGPREQNFIQAVLSSGAYKSINVNFWIGATDMSREGGWKWVDNSAFSYLNWYPGEPNNFVRGTTPEDCSEMVPRWNYQWNDQRCHFEQLYICKKRALVSSVSTLTPPTTQPITKTCVGEAMLSGNYSLVDDHAFTASSARDPQHLASFSRYLPGTTGAAWSATYNNGSQFLTASFFNTIVVKGITTAGRTDNDEWVTQYKIQFLEDYYSDWLTYNQPPGTEKVFSGSTDSSSPVSNPIQFPFEARAVRIVPVAWHTGISLRWEILGCMEEDCHPDYGVSGPLVVDDTSLTASTLSFGSSAAQGRLKLLRPISGNVMTSCWRPVSSNNPSNQWIQVDLGMVMVIRGVSTMGNPVAREWVKSYKVSYGIQASSLKYYTEPYSVVKTLLGNTDSTTLVTNMFKSHFQGRFVRIIPVSYQGYIALRFDVLVCPRGCRGVPLITGPNPVDNELINASSELDGAHAKFRSRLHQKSQGAYAGAWIPAFNDNNQYIQVDLGFMIQITGIATQGDSDSQDWTTTYTLKYSNDGTNWNPYYELGSQPKLILGNWDNTRVQKHYLLIPFIARYIRLLPVGFHHRIAVRWELYGCPGADSGRKIGCYADNTHDRDLAYEPYSDATVGMWPPMCIHHCFRKGYYYAGIQNQFECYCGNSYGRYGPAQDCTLSCLPKKQFMCGGVSSNQVYSTGLSPSFKVCPSNWKAYNNRCYILILDKLAWFDARAECQVAGGDLAAPNSQQEQDFVYSLLQYSTGNDSWIGLNDIQTENLFRWTASDPVLYTNWNVGQPRPAINSDEDCVMMTSATGGWQDESCDSPHSFACQMEKRPALAIPKPTTVSGCENGWNGYRWSCYLYADSPRSWSQAASSCATFGATLVRVDDRYEQAYLSSSLGIRKGMYWTDASDVSSPGTFKYNDGRPYVAFTNWAQHKPDGTSQCVALGSGNISGLWYNQPCQNKLGMVCEKLRIGYTAPTLPPPTRPPPTCDPGLVQAGGYCYEINTRPVNQLLSWSEAKQNCENRGANLASFHDAQTASVVFQQSLIKSTGRFGFWIGLNDRSVEGGYTWTDGSPVQFQKWSPMQPNNSDGDRDCIVMERFTGTWHVDNCNSLRQWICMVNAGTHLYMSTTIPAPTAGPSSMCKGVQGWQFYNGHCYYSIDGFGTEARTWRTARRYCQQYGGDLASVTSFNEQLFVQQTVLGGSKANAVWIGLNELDSERGFSWSDGTPVSYMNWDQHEANNLGGTESCVSLTIRHGQWNDQHCAITQGYVCKKLAGAAPTPITPTAHWTGFCPAGMSLYNNICYQVFTQAVDWQTANRNCQAMGKSYSLASVGSDYQNAFLITLLAEMKMVDPWLGMSRSTNQWQWTSQDDITYTNWANGEPSARPDEKCVHMWGTSHFNVGFWNDVPCNTQKGYICQTSKKTYIPTPEPMPNICDVRQHFEQFNTDCYLFTLPAMTWSGAYNNCNHYGGYLVSINSPSEQAFIYLMVKRKLVPAIWTGFSDQKKSGVYQWADGWPVMYTNWDVNEPSRGANEGCVMFNSSGLWNDINCNMTLSSVCKVHKGSPPLTPLPPNGSCDPGWYLFQGKCYLFRLTEIKTFSESNFACMDLGATVVSIHNDTVNSFLTHTASALSSRAPSFWTSLHKSIVSGFRWTDNTPLAYTNWRPNEPSVTGWSGNTENCVEVFLSDSKWNDEDCSSQRAYICEKNQVIDLVGPGGILAPTPIHHLIPSILPPQEIPTPKNHYSGPPTPKPPGQSTPRSPSTIPGNGTKQQQQQQSDSPAASLQGGAIAGIVLGIVLIICLALGGVFIWRRRTLGSDDRLESPVEGFENRTYRYDSSTGEVDTNNVSLRSMSESSS